MKSWRWVLGLILTAALAGCGDDVGAPANAGLVVSRGGSGVVSVPSTSEVYTFDNSITVAVRGANDAADQFTIYTLFGVSELDYAQVPTAALVTFVNGLLPDQSYAVTLPSSQARSVLHTGFSALGVNALRRFNVTVDGTFLLEPQPLAGGGFQDQGNPNRRARWLQTRLQSTTVTGEATVTGNANYVLSGDVSQAFFGYIGNLGLTYPPSTGGGGPPPPPGDDGGTGGDGPPPPPL